ncbi:hypothetical protein [Natronoglycomyces albus]|uniref:Anti-sigma regulatory factor n=1 Tax=Natronoglycomyces albus TaxID=2811108 RepID=A0A895XN18_9ACTN|nr:hypothetical protein [Natronoglycomyces albus]QSB04435.1 hypothetical protein JQS30_11620 [Natronoglycomyces albus]
MKTGDDVLLLEVPSGSEYMSVLPTATAGVATRLGFGLADIEDLRAAVNAAATLLLESSSAIGTTLRCRLEVSATDLMISIEMPGRRELPSSSAYQWQVLQALAGDVSTAISETETHIQLRQPRPPTEADMDTHPHQAAGPFVY